MEKNIIKKIEEIGELYYQVNMKFGSNPTWDDKYNKLIEIKKMFDKNPLHNYNRN